MLGCVKSDRHAWVLKQDRFQVVAEIRQGIIWSIKLRSAVGQCSF